MSTASISMTHVSLQRFPFLIITIIIMALHCANAFDMDDLIETPQSAECLEHALYLVKFVKREGGTFNDEVQELKLTPDYGIGPQTASSGAKIGVYAKETIEEGTVLSRVPWKIVIDDQDIPSYAEDKEEERAGLLEHAKLDPEVIAANEAYVASLPNMACPTFRNLLREVLMDGASKVAPYFHYLYSARRTLPAHYGKHSKKMLEQLLMKQTDEELPLLDSLESLFLNKKHFDLCDKLPSHKHTGAFIEREAVARLVAQFAAHGGLMIPTLDFYGHRNGKYLNTNVTVKKGEYVEIVASRKIEVGEGIYTSYSDCEGCDPQHKHYDMPDLFRDHGYLERYPQRWAIPGECVYIEYNGNVTSGEVTPPKFLYDYQTDIVEREGGKLYWRFSEPEQIIVIDKNETDGSFILTWDQFSADPEDPTDIVEAWPAYREELRRIQRLKKLDWLLYDQETLAEVHSHEWDNIHSLHQAYVDVLEQAILYIEKFQAGKSKMVGHYDDFVHEGDGTTYNELDCQSSELIDFLTYEPYEKKQSNYQLMDWTKREADNDTCLHLDDMLQICSSYRPHYHEFFIHFPAQYVEKVKRVIYLGSGDAMLLHEILKYPDLEKVVGLELDQDITRTSFRYFKTQPHYDDPRVEWWYGDATKTLPLLPKSYWGSFDLVLVDLSETVVSMDVTGQHDILDVLENLLKPEGVLLENELYIDKFTNHFDHTIHIFYGSPKVCTQVLTLASNKVDFLHQPLTDHGIDNYLVHTPKEEQDKYTYIHDYLKSYASKEQCNAKKDLGVVQGKPAGVLEVVNYEGIQNMPGDKLEKKLFAVAKKLGFTTHSVATPTLGGYAFVSMNEGYIFIRCWQEKNYCAADFNLWGAFSKRNALRRAFRQVFKATTVSDYRVVVQGMYGSKTLKKDQEEIGIRFSQNRFCGVKDVKAGAKITEKTVKTLAVETANVLDEANKYAVVICGEIAGEKCVISEAMANNKDYRDVLTIYTCPEIAKMNLTEDASKVEDMYDCELQVLDQLFELPPIDLVLIDDSVPFSMMQVFASILGMPEKRTALFKPKHLIALPFTHTSNYKARFLAERYRLEQKNLISGTTFIVEGDEDKLGWVVAFVGDDYSMFKLEQMEGRLKEALPNLDVEIRTSIGGKKHTEKDLEYESWTFEPEKYDSSPNEIQNTEQESLGRQSIVQLNWSDENAGIYTSLALLQNTLQAMKFTPQRFSTFKDVGDGGGAFSTFTEGSAVLVYDGKEGLVLNLFLFDDAKAVADKFIDTFKAKSNGTLEGWLRDDQPRGVGRVVNFSDEIKASKTGGTKVAPGSEARSAEDTAYQTEEL
ncbi:unnamed protein product [Cylindrotheca closterium]|uniref:PABS domain-containing protein n=1 Tax=Cylindrotheca closterium TaxID=2856 RepID=A0AAD2JHZ1_9STRA|nr:unnamed protein product [Cylindrotheca closterium]